MERVESLNRQYLRMTSERNEGDGMEGYRSRILQRNRVEGLLRMDQRHLDGVCYAYYDITFMGSMEEIYAGRKMTEICLEEVFDGLEAALQDMEAYLLRQSDLCLKPEYVMRNSETGRWAFLYISGYKGNQTQDLERLAEYIMEHMDYADELLQERVYALYDDVVRLGGKVQPAGLLQLWRKTGKEREEEASELPVSEAVIGTREKSEAEKEKDKEKEKVKEKEKEKEQTAERNAEKRKIYIRKIYRTPYRGVTFHTVAR